MDDMHEHFPIVAYKFTPFQLERFVLSLKIKEELHSIAHLHFGRHTSTESVLPLTYILVRRLDRCGEYRIKTSSRIAQSIQEQHQCYTTIDLYTIVLYRCVCIRPFIVLGQARESYQGYAGIVRNGFTKLSVWWCVCGGGGGTPFPESLIFARIFWL